MKLTLNRKNLLSSLKQSIQAVSNKSLLPIYEYFLIESIGSDLYITATDGETRIKSKYGLIESDINVSFCADAKKLIAAIESITYNDIILDVSETFYSIIYKNGRFEYPIISSNDFPIAQTYSDGTDYTINASDLKNALQKTIPFSSKDDLRPNLFGVFIQIGDDHIVAVSTDTTRLMAFRSDNVSPLDSCIESDGFILSSNATVKVIRMITGESDITVKLSDKFITISSDIFELSTLLVEGRFPNWKSVIPKNYNKIIEIEKKALSEALKRVSLCSNINSGLLKMTIESSVMGGKIILYASDLETSVSSTEILECTYSGDNISIGLKSMHFHKLLETYDGETVLIELTEPSKPIILKQKDNESMIALLMPMILQ